VSSIFVSAVASAVAHQRHVLLGTVDSSLRSLQHSKPQQLFSESAYLVKASEHE
jgi:hypothetical protein